ncbi:MAG: DHH family phosphoesterase [Oscillospiraceae bacterium]|nr:DHH family phosphoesterase [Oscillospiraceae bacterium]
MKGKRWTAFKMVSLLLVVVSLACAFSVYEVNEVRFWTLLAITALSALAFLTLFSASQQNLHKFVTEMESQLNLTERDSLYKFPAPAVIVDGEGIIVWYNIAFTEQVCGDDVFGLHINKLFGDLDLQKSLENKNTTVSYETGHFRISAVTTEKRDDDSELLSELTLLYFDDISDYINLERRLNEIRPAIILISVDNYEDILSGEKDSEKAHIMIQLDKLLEAYFEEHKALLKKLSSDRFMAIAEENQLGKMIENKFKILEKVRNINVTEKFPITLSIGVGINSEGIQSGEKEAKQALEMAQGRGGDQAAVKTENGFEFFGGVAKGIEKNTKVKTRFVATALMELINSCDSVIIMGHRYGDLDSVGSGAGMCGAVRLLNPDMEAYMAVDYEKCLAKPIIDRLNENLTEELPIFISTTEAMARMNDRTLLIVTDTHNKDIIESTELYEAAKHIAVIDHHRQTVNFIDNAVIFHHEPYASSASEMTAELIQYFPGIDKLQSYYADAMLAGIMLDTKDFVMRTGVRTFEAAAFLRKLGADMVAVKGLFANTLDCVKHRSQLISATEIYNRCGIAMDESGDSSARVSAAQAADEMLSILGVDASFVIFKTPDGGINISARSRGAMNVQIIMEKLGGGGHQTMAAAQFRDISINEAKAKLIGAIDEHIANIS